MATMTCAQADALIAEVKPLGCKSPWEVELAKLALENRIAGSLAGGGAGVASIRTVSDDYDVLTTDCVVLVDASGGAKTVTLPQASTVTGRIFTVKKIDSSANGVTLDGFSTETIDGSGTKSLATQYKTMTVISTGTLWYILSSF